SICIVTCSRYRKERGKWFVSHLDVCLETTFNIDVEKHVSTTCLCEIYTSLSSTEPLLECRNVALVISSLEFINSIVGMVTKIIHPPYSCRTNNLHNNMSVIRRLLNHLTYAK